MFLHGGLKFDAVKLTVRCSSVWREIQLQCRIGGRCPRRRTGQWLYEYADPANPPQYAGNESSKGCVNKWAMKAAADAPQPPKSRGRIIYY